MSCRYGIIIATREVREADNSLRMTVMHTDPTLVGEPGRNVREWLERYGQKGALITMKMEIGPYLRNMLVIDAALKAPGCAVDEMRDRAEAAWFGVLSALGDEGWEPFALQEGETRTTYHFRRQF